MIYTIPVKEMAMLSALYSQSHRHYHNINHINFCLAELEKYEQAIQSLNDLQLLKIVTHAIWWHDAIYNPYSSINEESSEDLFRDYHHDVSSVLTFDERECVREAIRATKYHTIDQANLPLYCQVMLDIDLAGLGQDWSTFYKNGEEIRQEYAHLDDGVFNRGRVEFFEALSKRTPIYYTYFFRSRYEPQARENVDNEIRRLYSL